MEGERRWRKKSPECFAVQSSETKTGIAFDLSILGKKKIVFYYVNSASELDCPLSLSINIYPLIFHKIYR